jgi:glycosyltransferase involved in cell wall biosynthesis
LRVLVVVPFPLHAEGVAAARCLIGLMRGLALHGVDVRALAVDPSLAKAPPPPPDLNVALAHVDYSSTGRARWDRLVAPYSLFTRGGFGERLRALGREADVVHIHGIGAGALLPLVSAPVVAQVDCVTRRDRDIGQPWTRDGRIANEMLRAERLTRRRARWLLASSDEVAADFARSAPRARVMSAPLALDPAHYPARASLDEPIAGLIGTARWPPTANAVERLLTSVWPRVLERRPGARLLLAGEGMEPATFSHLPSPPGVEWLGRVASATTFLTSLGALLYPVTRGSGAKIKVLEAMLLGVPVITTAHGAEGILGDGGMLVESDDDALARSTDELLGDADARRRMGAAAHARFMAHHAPLPASAPVLALYERMLADPAN